MTSDDEMFDVCDEHDRVISQASRADVHAGNLLHRAVHIWVFNSRHELLIHERSALKDQYPGCITSSASGHVDAGEDYLTAARRELLEELDLRGDLEYIVKLPASAETAFEHTVLYSLETDAVPTPDPLEIAALEYRTVDEVRHLVATSPERFTPPFRALMAFWIQASR